jgi:preprotein translocase subunit SecA
MRLFGSDRIVKTLDRFGFKEGDMIEHSMVSKSIERAQKKVEENNFGIRKRLLEYDDVMNKQRTVVYTKRRHALMGERIGMDIVNMVWDSCCNIAENLMFEEAKMESFRLLSTELPIKSEEEYNNMAPEKKAEALFDAAMANFKHRTEHLAQATLPFIDYVYNERPEMHDRHVYVPITDGRHIYQIPVSVKLAYESRGKEVIKCFEKAIMLHTIDEAWKENLRDLDDLKHSVQNASYEQKDPLLIFKLESVTLFDKMISKINDKTISILMRGQLHIPEREQTRVKEAPAPNANKPKQSYNESKADLSNPHQQAAAQHDTRENAKKEPVRVDKSVGRNDPCPCGSGKKYKNCCGKN